MSAYHIEIECVVLGIQSAPCFHTVHRHHTYAQLITRVRTESASTSRMFVWLCCVSVRVNDLVSV